jgi:hypothetical protein
MVAFEGAARRPVKRAHWRDGAGAMLWAVLWPSVLGLVASAILASAGFDLGAVLLLLE